MTEFVGSNEQVSAVLALKNCCFEKKLLTCWWIFLSEIKKKTVVATGSVAHLFQRWLSLARTSLSAKNFRHCHLSSLYESFRTSFWTHLPGACHFFALQLETLFGLLSSPSEVYTTTWIWFSKSLMYHRIITACCLDGSSLLSWAMSSPNSRKSHKRGTIFFPQEHSSNSTMSMSP